MGTENLLGLGSEDIGLSPTRLECGSVLDECSQQRSCSKDGYSASIIVCLLGYRLTCSQPVEKLCLIPVKNGCSFGRTTYPLDPSLDGSRLSCYCPHSNKTPEQGNWDSNIVMVILTEYGKPELIANLLKNLIFEGLLIRI